MKKKKTISLEKINLAWQLQSRLKFSISTVRNPHKNRGLVGGSLEIFDLAWKFQSGRAILNFSNLWALRVSVACEKTLVASPSLYTPTNPGDYVQSPLATLMHESTKPCDRTSPIQIQNPSEPQNTPRNTPQIPFQNRKTEKIRKTYESHPISYIFRNFSVFPFWKGIWSVFQGVFWGSEGFCILYGGRTIANKTSIKLT